LEDDQIRKINPYPAIESIQVARSIGLVQLFDAGLIIKPMSEFPHDDFAKSYLIELLSLIGYAKANYPLKSETLAADLWFELSPQQQERVSQLGLLGQLMTKNSLIEVFRNPATLVEIRACQRKLSILEGRLIRQAKRNQRNLKEEELPELWLIMPTTSSAVKAKFGISRTDESGIYRFPEGQRVGLIVVHQLALTEETRWLRMLGRNGKQQQAIAEFGQAPKDNDLCASIEEILASYRTSLEQNNSLSQEDEALIMQLSEAYLKRRQEWREEARAEGLAEGLAEGRQESLRSVALGLLREGIAVAVIARTTGLSIETIEQLQPEIGH
jgi:hypothetical protein